MHQYKNLIVWQKAVKFSIKLYRITKEFPEQEKFGLISQIRRAGVSIPSNIAEGSKRSTKKDFRSFLVIASGSGAELETQLYISKELQYISEKEYNTLIIELDEVMKILTVFIKKLN
jgi:four helix bundle protein